MMKHTAGFPARCVRLRRGQGPERIPGLCRAAVLWSLGRPISLGYDNDPLSLLLASAMVSGIRRAGGRVLPSPGADDPCRLSCRIRAGRRGAELWFFRGNLPKNAEICGIPRSAYWQNP